MKVAIITGYWNPPNFKGGISRVIFELRNEWQKMGQTVDIYATNTVHNEKEGIFRVPIPPFPLQGLWINLYMLLFSSLDKYSVLFPQSAFQCLFLDKKRCIPFIHTLYNVEHLVPWRFWKYAIAPLEKYALRNIRGCIALDDKTINTLKNELHVPKDKILQVNNGVDYSLFCPAPRETQKDFVILSAGRFIPRKRFDLLIKAFALFVDLHGEAKLVIAGDGELRSDLHGLVHHLHIEGKVLFPGMVDEHNMLKLYRSASIFVLPSISEGMPMVVLEAQACALPVVLGDFESAHDLAIEGETGYIVRDTDPEAWAQVFIRFYEEPFLLKTFGERARNHIESKFRWPAVAKKIINYFQDILDGVSNS
ncbi:putative Phosphatidylinositol alpha-mannosyltransferase [uncultured Desulfobacterium sp.]|uniref:Putative Phosphatidylinositol alpha-mannosyltransferase n=1 Tax=uncultured Desulfobacterium sp. TaxID=201089 RepID=A0A445MYU3_9BACT|nr:putative Phosphatidylinositol alpha-mannosyltransferase [uncultured Desulfobacterium sp.]